MRLLRQRRLTDVLYIFMIIAVLLCGNYRKIISNYEENTGVQYWIQVGDQERMEQQVNLLQYPYEIMEYKVSIFYRAENAEIGDGLEFYLQGESMKCKVQCDFEIKSGIQQININLPDDLGTGKYQLILIPHIDSLAQLEIGMSQDRFNLKNAVVNETEEDGHLALIASYNIFELEKDKIIYRNFTIGILITMVLTAIVCLYQDHGKYRVFICSFIIVFAYIILSYFELFFDAVPFIEDGALFGESARYESFQRQIFIKDAGYLCILQHVVAWFCVRVLALGHQAYLGMNLIAIVFISLMDSLINLPIFKKVADRKIRFLVSMCIPILFARQYESYAFINFIYWGIMLILLMLFIDLDALRRRTYMGLLILEVLICLSKGIYAMLLPVVLLYLFMLAVTGKYSKRKVCFWLCIGFAGLVQILCYMTAGSRAVSHTGISWQLVMRILMQTGRMALGITPLLTSYSNEIVLIGLGILVCVCGLLDFIKGITMREMRYVLLTVFIALGVCNSIMVEINAYYDKKEIALWYARQEFFSISAYLFVLMLIVSRIKRYRDIINFGLLLLLGLFCMKMSVKDDMDWVETPNTINFSVAKMDTMDWDVYGSYWDDENYFIKIMPSFFSLSRSVFVDYYSSDIDHSFLGVNDDNYENSSIPCNIIPNQNIEKIDVIEDTRLWGIYFLKNGVSNQYEVRVYDNLGNLLGCETQPDRCNEKSCIIKFEESVENASYIIFHDLIADREVNILPEYAIVAMK